MASKAKNLSQLSDAELEEALASSQAQEQTGSISDLSDEELMQHLAEADAQEPGFLDQAGDLAKRAGVAALRGAGAVGEFFDKYTGAPTRQALGVLQEDFTKVPEAAEAFKKQFGEDPALAPSSKQIFQRAGVPDTALSDVLPGAFTEDPEKAKEWLTFQKGGPADITASGAAGLAGDIAFDWSNIIPIGATAKLAGKAGIKGIEEVSKIAGKAAKGAGEIVAPAITKGVIGTAEQFSTKAKQLASMVMPSVRKDFIKSSEVAVKHGIDPELLTASVKYGPESFVSKARRVQAQGPLGEQLLIKHNEGMNQIRRATDDVIGKIAGGTPPASTVEAGNALKKGFEDVREKFFDQMDFTYRSSASQLPGQSLTGWSKSAKEGFIKDLDKISKPLRRDAKNMALTSGTREQAKTMLQYVESLKAQAPKMRYAKGMGLLNDMKQAFKSGVKGAADIPIDRKTMQDIYGATSEALTRTVGDFVGAEAEQALRKNNKAMTEWFRTTEDMADVLTDPKIAGESVFRNLIERGDSNMLEKMKGIMGNDVSFKQAKAAFIDQLKHNADFSFERMASKLEDPKTQRILNGLFDPSEVQEINELVKLGQDMGPPILNYSGTEVSQAFKKIPEQLMDYGVNTGLTDYLERVANQRALKQGLLPPPQIPTDLLPTIGGAVKEIAPKADAFQSYMQSVMPTRGQVYRKGAQEISIQEREMPVFIPPENREDARSEIMNIDMPNTERARLLNELNRSGNIPQRILDTIQGGE